MSGLDQLITNTSLLQDEALAKSLTQLKGNPSQLQLFLQGQQNGVYKDIIKQKDATLDRVYGGLEQTTTKGLDKRNSDLVAIQEELYQKQHSVEQEITKEKQLAERKYEMNEWSVNNKKETLYIYSLFFILLSGIIFLTVLWRMGIISSALCGGLILPFVLLFTFILIYRTKYTNVHRNKRYWNRRSFEDKYGLIPLPSICPDGADSAPPAPAPAPAPASASAPAPASASAPASAPTPTPTSAACNMDSECSVNSCCH
jgi:hypothetical protein